MRALSIASARLAAASAALGASSTASAALLQGEALDRMADIVALAVLIVVPIGLIAPFWPWCTWSARSSCGRAPT